MARRGVTGSFASGGITGAHAEMLEAGLFRALLNAQCFDLAAVASYQRNTNHVGISAATYAGIAVNPRRDDLIERLTATDLPICTIEDLAAKAAEAATKPTPVHAQGRVMAISEYRDGSVTDVIRQIEED
ncbi:MAG: hypothetical protein HUJ27_10455 [Rhodobacteraceae bacterium]|nr:hypothetical protein [Paracoccaceae bacterium]